MKALVGAFNQEKALVQVGGFSVIVQLHRLIDLRHYDEVGRELEEVVAEGPQPEHHRALPQEPAPVGPHVVVGGGPGHVTRDT